MRIELLIFGTAVGGLIAVVAHAATIEVGQKDKTFAPETIVAAVGTTIRINNDDGVVHNVLVTTPDSTTNNTGIQKPGESIDFVVDKSGEYRVKCGIHPKMKLTIQSR